MPCWTKRRAFSVFVGSVPSLLTWAPHQPQSAHDTVARTSSTLPRYSLLHQYTRKRRHALIGRRCEQRRACRRRLGQVYKHPAVRWRSTINTFSTGGSVGTPAGTKRPARMSLVLRITASCSWVGRPPVCADTVSVTPARHRRMHHVDRARRPPRAQRATPARHRRSRPSPRACRRWSAHRRPAAPCCPAGSASFRRAARPR